MSRATNILEVAVVLAAKAVETPYSADAPRNQSVAVVLAAKAVETRHAR